MSVSARNQLARHHLLLQRAAQHRANPTPAERQLWSLLRAKQQGAWFRRQHVLGEFIVDFVALTPRLVVEVDGSAHRTRATADARRDRWLARQGYRVLRVSNAEVLSCPQDVAARVRAARCLPEPAQRPERAAQAD
ncbi:MAG: endonuclease domain-containing protein [Polyangiaceae bacterium]